MNTPTIETSDQQLEKVKSKAELAFEGTKQQALSLSIKCHNIIINDVTTLAMATQCLSQANEHVKIAKKKGLEMREPFTQRAKLIIELEKQITDPLEKAIEAGKLKLRAWNEIQEKKEQEAKALLEKEKNFLLAIETELNKKGDECISPAMCQELMDKIEVSPYWTKFATYKEDAFNTKRRFIELLKLKKVMLTKIVSGGKGSMKTLVELQQEQASASELSKEAVEGIEAKKEAVLDTIASEKLTSSVRKTWKTEIVNIDDVPRSWMMPDPDKIKEYLTTNKATMVDGTIYGGIKFYIDKSPIIR